MIKLLLAIIHFILKRWVGTAAEKDRLLKKIRDCEYEMSKQPVGSDNYNRIRAEWLRLNKRWGDLIRRD